jgi:hypothetical protein
MSASRTLKLNILAETKDLVAGLNKAQSEANNAGGKMGAAFDKFKVAIAAAGAAVGAFAIKFGVDAVKAASNLSETISKVNVLFGKSAAEVNKFADSAAKNFGQSKQQALDAAATFATFGKAAGLAGDDLVKFSTDFTGLASDLASFNNTTPEQAITAIGAALRGEAEPLRNYGVLLNDATLKQAALELGIISTTNQALTPQQKVLAAQKVIYEQTGAAQGDFARTSEGLANQQRILAAEFENVKASVGNALLPVVTEFFSLINNNVIPVLEKLSDSFNKNVGPAFEKLWNFIKVNVLPIFVALGKFIFEELIPVYRNILVPVIEQVVTTLQNLSLKVRDNQTSFNELGAILDRVWFFIKTYLAPVIEFVLVQKLKELEAALNFIIDATQKVINNFERIIQFIPGLDLALKALGIAWRATGAEAAYQTEKTQEAAKSWFTSSVTAKTEYAPAVKEVGKVFETLTNTTNTATTATKNFTGATKASTVALQEQFNVMQSLDLMRAGFASAVGGVVQPGSANLKPQLPGGETFRSAAELVSQFGGKVVGFNAKPGDPFYGFTKGDTLQTFKPGQTGNTNVVINVNGTVINPEGTARAIADVLKGSTGRAGNLPLTPLLGIQ